MNSLEQAEGTFQ